MELLEAGFSMAVRHMTCSRWFCMMSRIIPNSSKYPPRPIVPNGSLNVMITLAMLFRFQIGCRKVLANLRREEGEEREERRERRKERGGREERREEGGGRREGGGRGGKGEGKERREEGMNGGWESEYKWQGMQGAQK